MVQDTQEVLDQILNIRDKLDEQITQAQQNLLRLDNTIRKLRQMLLSKSPVPTISSQAAAAQVEFTTRAPREPSICTLKTEPGSFLSRWAPLKNIIGADTYTFMHNTVAKCILIILEEQACPLSAREIRQLISDDNLLVEECVTLTPNKCANALTILKKQGLIVKTRTSLGTSRGPHWELFR